jgi:uncharacterized phage-associated protein
MHAMTVAKWFVERANGEFVDDGGVAEGISNLKLQKLLYFAQAASLSTRGETLFDDAIEAWKFGPVVPNVYREFKRFGNDAITDVPGTGAEAVPAEVALLLEDVWRIYGKYSAFELVNMTHAQKPWKDVFMKDGTGVITVEAMREYYRGYYNAA